MTATLTYTILLGIIWAGRTAIKSLSSSAQEHS